MTTIDRLRQALADGPLTLDEVNAILGRNEIGVPPELWSLVVESGEVELLGDRYWWKQKEGLE
jgi:hypothetical protein